MKWLLVVLLALCACSSEEDSYALRHFPELERVDPGLERVFRQLLERGSSAGLHERADLEGAPAAWALLKILADEFSDEVLVATIAAPERDPEMEAAAWNMGRVADDDLKRVLLRGLADRELHARLRRKFVIALARRGATPGPLLDVALERREDADLRRSILARIHRTGAPAPPRLHQALQLPFEGLDRVAAATLARMGSFEAPSLVLEGLEHTVRDQDLLTRHYVNAGNRITGADLQYPDALSIPTGQDPMEAEARLLQPHIESLRDWLARHPPRTVFERSRQTYLDSARRDREMKLTSFRDILAAGENFDLASAALLLTTPRERERQLEALDRLARFLRRQMDGADDAARIDVLNHWLLPDTVAHDYLAGANHVESMLGYVLRHDSGDCLAYSTLYLAVAERCELPLFGVSAPRHVFVRWDNGSTRRNIETTSRGSERPDAAYVDAALRRVPALAKLPSMTKRQMLASVLNNYAGRESHRARHDEAREILTNALRLDPDNLLARHNRAIAAFHSDLGADTAVVADLERTLALHPGDPEGFLAAGWLFLELGRFERSREAFGHAAKLEPSDAARAGRVLCAARLATDEFPAETLHELRASKSDVLRLAATEALIRLEPTNPRAAMEWADTSLETHLRVANVLLDVDPPRPEDALRLLGQAEPRLRKQLQRARETIYRTADPAVPGRAERNFLLLKAKALLLLNRRDEALEVFREAEQVWGTTRLLLEVRRALRS